MNEVFGPSYADAYDCIYADKDYPGECDLLAELFAEHAPREVKSVLDLGCGTGNHALELARRGYEVVGVDRSVTMIEHARTKAQGVPGEAAPSFHQAPIAGIELGRSFDVALMMFAVLGYHHQDEEVIDALRATRRHLDPGGLLIFDVWFGPAVLHEGPGRRIKSIPTATGEIRRTSFGRLDLNGNICHVHFQLERLEDSRVVDTSEERHTMRFFFPDELERMLEESGLAMVKLGAFPEFHEPPDESTWNVLAVARAV